MAYDKPLPEISEENAPFYDALKRHALALQRCADCGAFRYPPSLHCPHCLSEAAAWTPVSGRGRVYSWIVMHQVYDAAFRSDVPYNVAVVELDEGPRLTTNIVGRANDAIRIDMPVSVVYDDVSAELTLARFRPLDVAET